MKKSSKEGRRKEEKEEEEEEMAAVSVVIIFFLLKTTQRKRPQDVYLTCGGHPSPTVGFSVPALTLSRAFATVRQPPKSTREGNSSESDISKQERRHFALRCSLSLNKGLL